MRSSRRLVVGLYAWAAAVGLGATLVDLAYAARISPMDPATSEVGDALLWVAGLTILTGIAATAAAWDRERARNMVFASLVLVTVGLVVPPILSGVAGAVEGATDLRIGPWLRLGLGGLASLLALAGLWDAWGSEATA